MDSRGANVSFFPLLCDDLVPTNMVSVERALAGSPFLARKRLKWCRGHPGVLLQMRLLKRKHQRGAMEEMHHRQGKAFGVAFPGASILKTPRHAPLAVPWRCRACIARSLLISCLLASSFLRQATAHGSAPVICCTGTGRRWGGGRLRGGWWRCCSSAASRAS